MPIDGEAAGRFAFVLAQLVGNELYLWTVTRLWSTGLSDVVLMRLSPFSEGAQRYKFQHLAIDLAPPRVGDPVYGFGYSESAVSVDDKKSLRLEQRASTTHGTVVTELRDNTAEWVDVKRGASVQDLVEVFGNLNGGDQVAVRATDELRAGTKVRPMQQAAK